MHAHVRRIGLNSRTVPIESGVTPYESERVIGGPGQPPDQVTTALRVSRRVPAWQIRSVSPW